MELTHTKIAFVHIQVYRRRLYFERYIWSNLAKSQRAKENKTSSLSNQLIVYTFSLKVVWSGMFLKGIM